MRSHKEIKMGLEACIAGECHSNRIKCPYRKENDCTTTVVEDALALIHQLEAKIAEYEKPLAPMTFEEAIMDDFYLEIKGEEYVDMAFNDFAVDMPDEGFVLVTTPVENGLKLKRDDYGKTWRCWSRRPTDEERKAAKWDECG